MRIGFPTFGCDSGKSGIGHYATRVLREFAQMRPDWEFVVPVFADEIAIFIPDAPNVKAHVVSDRFKHPVPNLVWTQLALPRLVGQYKLDAIFLPAANRRIPLKVPCPLVGVVHDYSSIHMEKKYDPFRMFYITQVLPFLHRRLDQVVTISEHSKKDITGFARVPEDKVDVVYIGVDTEYYHPQDQAAAQAQMLERHGIRAPYLLYISRIEHPGKNHVRLIQAFEKLKAEHDLPHTLVCAGSDWNRAEAVHEVHRKSPVRDDITFTGFFPGEDVQALYGGADGFVFPSLFEGFGMPLVEAMATEIPCACSNISSLPEVAGGAALLFDPYNVDEITQALAKLTADRTTHDALVAKARKRAGDFRWDACAEGLLQHLENQVALRQHAR